MSTYRQSIREYMEASESLSKIDDLTDEEIESVQEMLDRLSAKLNSGEDGPAITITDFYKTAQPASLPFTPRADVCDRWSKLISGSSFEQTSTATVRKSDFRVDGMIEHRREGSGPV